MTCCAECLRRDSSPYVFVGQGSDPISDTSLRNVLRENGLDRHTASLHGFRSTFRDWCAENHVADDVAEACLAHSVPDKVVAAYKRTTFTAARADVMLTWGLYLS
jgi:integrase